MHSVRIESTVDVLNNGIDLNGNTVKKTLDEISCSGNL